MAKCEASWKLSRKEEKGKENRGVVVRRKKKKVESVKKATKNMLNGVRNLPTWLLIQEKPGGKVGKRRKKRKGRKEMKQDDMFDQL